MTGAGIIALYHDQDPERPNEAAILRALACVIEGLIKLRGREPTAELFELAADKVRSGEIWTLGETGPWGTA